ncbi:MAG TPA: alpha/beta hydrolase [Chryseolinea sp.]
MKELFLLSGLGADKRVFDYLDLGRHNIHHVNWIAPVPNESLKEYARRLLPQITAHRPILIGVSFGGMIALEIANITSVEKVILISSAKSASAIPSYYRVISAFRLDRLISPASLKKPNEVFYWLFGVTTKEHKSLLKSIMQDTDEKFLNWAMAAIPSWMSGPTPENVIQIHGTSDRILKGPAADYLVKDGGHLMVVTKAEKVNEILHKILDE